MSNKGIWLIVDLIRQLDRVEWTRFTPLIPGAQTMRKPKSPSIKVANGSIQSTNASRVGMALMKLRKEGREYITTKRFWELAKKNRPRV